MKTHSLLSSLALFAALVLAAPANADQVISVAPTDESPALVAHGGGAPAGGRISLSTDQLEKLVALKDQYKLDTASKKAELRKDYHQLRDILSQPSVDKGAAKTLQGKINSIKNEIANSRLDMKLAVSDVFTAEQKEQMRKGMLKRELMGRGFKHGGRGKWGKGGHGCSIGKAPVKKPVAATT